VDNAWKLYAPATYRYAVITTYCGGIEAEPVFSNNIVKNIEVAFHIAITTNGCDSPLGAIVKLPGTYNYELPSTSTGVSFPKVWLGTYTLEITLPGFITHTEQITITQTTGTHEVELKEIVTNPYNVEVTAGECSAVMTWSHDAIQNFNGFIIYLNGEVVKTGVKANEYLFTGLEAGSYTAGVSASYCSENTESVTTEFTVDDCGIGIEDYEYEYNLYPNPAENMITIERANACLATIDLYNAMGMHIQSYETGEPQFEISVRGLAAGTYFFKITEGEKTTVKSFVKK
jgi:hypothetical protein